ncbi:hypothetical protein EX895_005969 [Sporisorium graminicola]|uniref:Uncharacterized protein n=1 Tax=Sporisorium graminicola TaxID=280036 RepID=A0A4V6ETE7_9BASI|nr:hypothetical protein EX895_005969 [Sporisorium graminicola]TKY84889.1 hypothetical protein EX895_005969 [Sporisorium graminicola]
MRFPLLTTLQVGLVAIAGRASPTGPLIERVFQSISEHDPATVTKWEEPPSLGSGSFLSPLPLTVAPKPHEQGSSSALALVDSQPAAYIVVPNRESTSARAASALPPAQGANGEPITPLIDFQFSNLLKDPLRTNWLMLPTDKVHLRSPWLNNVYQHLVTALPGRKSAIPFGQVELSDEQIASLIPRKRFFYPQGQVYKLHLPASWFRPPVVEPMELLFRYHSKLRWSTGDQLKSSITFWSTTEGGSKMAFLGAFHISWPSWKKFVEKAPGVERFVIFHGWDRSTGVAERLFLVPKPPADS